MSRIPGQALRILGACWPRLLALYLAGTVAHHLLISLSAFVGSSVGLAAYFLLPLAILAKLIAYIGMFLVMRSEMRTLAEVEALAEAGAGVSTSSANETHGAAKTVVFWDVVTASILPFIAFYAAWGFLGEDTNRYASEVLAQSWGPADPIFGRGSALGINAVTLGATLFAYLARFALKRWETRLHRWTRVLAAYFEMVWLFLAAYVLTQLVSVATGWIGSRALVVWWEQLMAGIGIRIPVLDAVWNGLNWLIAEIGALTFLPLAWLAIAGVVYGRTIAAQKLSVDALAGHDARAARALTAFRARTGTVPQWWRDRGVDIRNNVIGRFKPITASLLLIWRAGALALGVYVLCFTLLDAGVAWLSVGVNQLLGPHSIDFWFALSPTLVYLAALVFEPARFALIAAAYDHSLGAIEKRGALRVRQAPDAAVTPQAVAAASEDSAEATHHSQR